MAAEKSQLPFSERYSLPAQVSGNLGNVSWETVIQISGDFQVKSHDKTGKVQKVLKELQMMRLLLLDKINKVEAGGERIDPALFVEIVRLVEKCEKISQEYEVDLREFSSFLYLLSEKIKRERLAHHRGEAVMSLVSPIKEELALLKDRGEVRRAPKNNRQRAKTKGKK